MTIYLATGNLHKRDEMQAIFTGHRVLLPSEAGVTGFDPDETGTTFAENALIKAETLHRALSARGLPGATVLADDSGLCVDALDGRPGIYSARYGSDQNNGAKLTDRERNALLLDEVGNATQRSARFVCALCLYRGKDRYTIAQETLEGEIIRSKDEIRGTGGFGYDPILYLPPFGRTVAELSAAEKNSVSHRARAAAIILSTISSGDSSSVSMTTSAKE
jgi:XTP/dITP diphosphohydrolase